jgi:hypothetical protein
LGSSGSIYASVAAGAAGASCFQGAANGGCAAADSFSVAFLEVGGSYGAPIGPRLLLSGKVAAGVTLFSPGPFTRRDGVTVPDALLAPHAGAGLALDYDTRLDHFGVGVDALVRYSVVTRPDGSGRSGVASLALMPRIRYLF